MLGGGGADGRASLSNGLKLSLTPIWARRNHRGSWRRGWCKGEVCLVAVWRGKGVVWRVPWGVDAHHNPQKFGPSRRGRHHPARSAAAARRGAQKAASSV